MNYKSAELGSMSTSDLIDSRLEERRIGTSNHCPSCGRKPDGRPDWLGLPAGVKFDPTDQELIEHLEGKVEVNKDMKSHPLIDEFIPTIEGEDGICYTHPEKLPGVTRDGLSRHFFHRPSKAYTTGTRKRRKIQSTDHDQCHDLQGNNISTTSSGETRWHKTGKTRPVMVNGKQKGCKKILVLYTNFGKNRKPEKTNWVMHQYHLGLLEEEKEGELVVSKIFYQTQPRQCNWSADRNNAAVVGGEGISDLSCKRESGSTGSCSSMEIVAQRQEEFSGSGVPNMSSGYNAMDIQQFKSEHFCFTPFRRSFDEVEVGEASTPREAPATSSTSENMPEHQNVHLVAHEYQHHHHQHHHYPDPIHHHIATAANFHISRPSNPVISTVVAPQLHHTSINILEEDPYHVSRIMLQNQLQEEQQQQHHKIGRISSGTGLEEVIMQCTTSSTDLKEESSVTHPQVTDPWIKYSSFWNDHVPDNPDHHHHHL